MSEVTRILTAIEQGDAKSTEELLPVVYHELRRLAAHKMASEPAGHTLQPTALVLGMYSFFSRGEPFSCSMAHVWAMNRIP